ncbi:MAG: DUF4398 domain-containing protein [Polyangiaceae bacterium]|nr:DUF4398 domain-containing protein [Polyangiaceae bacterium]
MKRSSSVSVAVSLAAAALWWGCGATYPLPAQRMADAESAQRSARELGADSKPTAQLSLKLAGEQIEAAKRAIARGDNRRADFLLVRARADAELALALAREQDALRELKTVADAATAAATATAHAEGVEQ